MLSVVLSMDGFREWLDRWAPAAEWGVAIGTIALAAATYLLARHTRREVKLSAQQLSAAQRPYVYPLVTEKWKPDAVAANPCCSSRTGVKGRHSTSAGGIYWKGTAGGAASLEQTALAADEDRLVRIEGVGGQVNFNVVRSL